MSDAVALLASLRGALDVLYGDAAAASPPSRHTRRAAERELLALRRDDPTVAMHACVELLNSANAGFALFAAQTVAHLCRFKTPEPTWAAALLGLIFSALDKAKPVLTQLSLAICALIARRHAWAAPEVVGAICQHLNVQSSVPGLLAALRLLLHRALPV